MSSFKRAEKSNTRDDNFKTFYGHPELDALLQNSLIKGQIIVMEEDSPTTIHQLLLRQFIGAAYQSGQASIIYDLNSNQWRDIIPTTSTKKLQAPPQQNQQQHAIAWRYSSMNMKFKLTNINKDIPLLDLQKSVVNPDPLLIRLNELAHFKNLKDIVNSVIDQYQTILKSTTDSTCKKLLLKNLFNPLISLDQGNLSRFLQQLKVFCRSSHLLTVISVPQNCLYKEQLLKFCDIYITITQIFQNTQFSDFQGILRIEKLGSFGSYKQILIEAEKWGIKIIGKGSQLEIEALYETAVQEDDQDEQNIKESMVCTSKPQNQQKLDF